MPFMGLLERIAKANEKEYQGNRLSTSRLNRPCRKKKGLSPYLNIRRKCD